MFLGKPCECTEATPIQTLSLFVSIYFNTFFYYPCLLEGSGSISLSLNLFTAGATPFVSLMFCLYSLGAWHFDSCTFHCLFVVALYFSLIIPAFRNHCPRGRVHALYVAPLIFSWCHKAVVLPNTLTPSSVS